MPGNFTVSNYTTFNAKFEPTTAVVSDIRNDQIVSNDLVADHPSVANNWSLVNEKLPTGKHVQRWRTDSGNVELCTVLENESGECVMHVFIKNGYTHHLRQVDVRLPTLTFPEDASRKIITGYQGGTIGWGAATGPVSQQGNTGEWPGYGVCPLATIYHETTGETFGIEFGNEQMITSSVYWFTGTDSGTRWFNPFLQLKTDLQPGQSLSTTVRYRYYATAGREAHWRQYRENFLLPMLRRKFGSSFTPTTYTTTAPWCQSVDVGGDYSSATYKALIDSMASYPIGGYVQWSPPDGHAIYDPHVPNLPWWNAMPDAGAEAAVKGIKFGCLVNPFMSPRIPITDSWLYDGGGAITFTNFEVNHSGYKTRRYLLREIKSLSEDVHVNVVFWDTGTTPLQGGGYWWGYYMQPNDYVDLIKTYHDHGIAVMTENGGDVTMAVSGCRLEFQFNNADYSMIKTVLPEATLFVSDQRNQWPTVTDPWWTAAEAKGLVPLMQPFELASRYP